MLGGPEEASISYAQLFRSGIIEAVSTLNWHNNDKSISSQVYEQEMIQGTLSLLNTFRTLEVEPPIYFFISILGIKNYTFAVKRTVFLHPLAEKSDRNDLILPEGLFNSLDQEPHKIFQPFFDMIWNAYGYERSFNYDEEGSWTGQT